MKSNLDIKGRHPCFMKDDLYKELKEIADKEGRTLFDITNIAINFYIDLYNFMKDDLDSLQIHFRLVKYLSSVGALTINTSIISPNDLSLLISSYLSSVSLTEEGKTNRIVATVHFIAQLLRGKRANVVSSTVLNDFVYSFESPSTAEYFFNFVNNLLKEEAQNIKYDIKKSDLLVEVKIEEKAK